MKARLARCLYRLRIVELLADRRGATAVEYGLIVGGIAVGVLVAVFALGDSLGNFFTNVSNTVDNNTPT